ncbi:MAG: DoxX family membrane protein [Chloroflexi bacterium]|nr:MAG: DoxX family membrane protein [Chloroflexota bacterium]
MNLTRLLFQKLSSLHPLVLSACRSLIGLLWLASLRWKLPPSFDPPPGQRGLMEWLTLEAAHPTIGLYADFVTAVVIPNFLLFAWLTFLVELVIGLSLTLGWWTRLGAMLGLLWSMNLAVGLLSVPGEWPWSYLMLVMWHALLLTATDYQSWGIDGWRGRRSGQKPEARR